MHRRARIAGLVMLALVVVVGLGIALPEQLPLCCGGAGQVGRRGKLLALRAASGTLVAWDAWKNRLWDVPLSGDGPAAAASDGNALVAVTNGKVILGDMHTGAMQELLAARSLRATHALASDGGRFVALSGDDGSGKGIWLADVQRSTVTAVSILPDGTRATAPDLLALSSDGRYVGFTEGGSLYAFDAFRGRSRQLWPQR